MDQMRYVIASSGETTKIVVAFALGFVVGCMFTVLLVAVWK